MSDFLNLSGEKLRNLRANRELSAEELLLESEKRIGLLNESLRAMVAKCPEDALSQAREIDSASDNSGLCGLPVAIKDLNDVKGLATTFGSPLFENNVASEDDDVVASVRKRSGVIIGKTNVPEHGFGATTTSPLFGSCGNPFNPELSAGASTGGGAVAVASGMATYATGSDFAGSLRTPAAFCGICGFRPSNGIVATNRRSLAWSSFDVEGPIARTAADCKRLLMNMARKDPLDPLTAIADPRLFHEPNKVELKNLRVAFSEDLGFAPMCNQYRVAFQKKLDMFRSLFGILQEASPFLENAENIFMNIRGLGFVADFGPMELEYGEKLGEVVLEELRRARNLSLDEVGASIRAHTIIFRQAVNFFNNYDILITPAAAVPPFPHEEVYPRQIDGKTLEGYLLWEGISWGITLTQCPAVVIPCGLSDGLPFGIQIVGRHLSDGLLLDIAHTLEQEFASDYNLARPEPDLKKLIETQNRRM